jgi:hypothetical protein
MRTINKIIAVDIDQTIFEAFDLKTGKSSIPNLKIINAINQLYENNYIIIYSSRLEEDRFNTVRDLKSAGIKYHVLVLEKLKADCYIDDKALNIQDIENIL